MTGNNIKLDIEYGLSVALLTDIITEADANAASGDVRLASQGRQVGALARIVLNLLGTVDTDTFDNTPAPTPEPAPAPAATTAVGQTGDGTVVKSPDQLTGPAPAGPNNAALGPDTTDAPANNPETVVATPSVSDQLEGNPVPDNNAGNQEPVVSPTPDAQPNTDTQPNSDNPPSDFSLTAPGPDNAPADASVTSNDTVANQDSSVTPAPDSPAPVTTDNPAPVVAPDSPTVAAPSTDQNFTNQ